MSDIRTPQYRLTITLATGEAHSFDVAKMPRHWKSWLMQQMPYGTPMQGAQFKREALPHGR
jgi:hypothetical protein